MSKKFQQLQKIRSWSLEQVQNVLKQNGLADCCESVRKREVDGDTLLTLTEGQLALWRDIGLPTKRLLLKLIEEIQSQPEKYQDADKQNVLPPVSSQIQLDRPVERNSPTNDSASWGSDFSDDKTHEVEYTNTAEPPPIPPLPVRPPVFTPKSENLPKPPLPPENNSYCHVRDIVSGLNLPEHQDPFDDEEYESLDTEAVVQNREAMVALLRQKLEAHPLVSLEENYEEYESIKETSKLVPGPGDEYYLQPIQPQTAEPPPVPEKPWPATKPPSPPRKQSEDVSPGNSADGVTGLFGGLLRKIRSPDSKERTATPNPKPVPLEPRPPTLNTQRPLPPTPENRGVAEPPRRSSRVELTQQPWYHSVDRKQSEELLRNREDGCFLVRPSSHGQNALTLTLWYNGRVYNIGIRRRPDSKFALGTEKAKEQSFGSVEELILNYQSERLVLYSGKEKMGRVLLTTSPPQAQ